MITLVLSNEHLYGCKWSKYNDSIEVEKVTCQSFNAPLMSKIADESQLNHQISGILQLCSQDLDLSGETFQVVIDDSLLLQDVIIIDPDVPNHIPNQYIQWHKEGVLGENSDEYTACVVERSGNENEYHVTYYPKLIPDIFKLSIRELGGYPDRKSVV